jgi:hypothetical protein
VIGRDVMVSRGFELTAQEHAARQVCKILGAGSLDSEGLRSRWLAIQHETSARSRSASGERDWDKVLKEAVSRGWIAERDGQYFATEAGQSIAKRSRAATGKSRVARLRSLKF